MVLHPILRSSRLQCICSVARRQHLPITTFIEQLNLHLESRDSIILNCCTVEIKFGIFVVSSSGSLSWYEILFCVIR